MFVYVLLFGYQLFERGFNMASKQELIRQAAARMTFVNFENHCNGGEPSVASGEAWREMSELRDQLVKSAKISFNLATSLIIKAADQRGRDFRFTHDRVFLTYTDRNGEDVRIYYYI